MDIEKIEHFVKIIEKSKLHTVVIENGRQSITVVNNLDKQRTIDPVEAKPDEERSDYFQVCSNYVGRVYLSKDKVMDNLVHEGDQIKKGQTICFIEVLNRLLPITSDREGIISDILIDNGQNIEYGQPILKVKM